MSSASNPESLRTLTKRIVTALVKPKASSEIAKNDPELRYVPADMTALERELLKTYSREVLLESRFFVADPNGGLRLIPGLSTPGREVLVVHVGAGTEPFIVVHGPEWLMLVAASLLHDLETRRRREACGGALIAVTDFAELVAWRQLGLGAVVVPVADPEGCFWAEVDAALPANSKSVVGVQRVLDGICQFQKTESEIKRDEKKKAAKPASSLGTILLAPTFDPMTWEPAQERAQRMARRLRSLVGATVKRSVSIAVWAPNNLAVWEKKSPSLTMLQSSLRKDLRTVEWLLGESGPPPAQHPLDLVKLRRRLENCTERTPEHERRAAAAAYREQFQQSFPWQPPAGQPASVLDALTPTLLRQLAAADAALALATNASAPRRREAAVSEFTKIGNLLLRVEGQRKGGRFGTRRGR